jgi:hypothetical protein
MASPLDELTKPAGALTDPTGTSLFGTRGPIADPFGEPGSEQAIPPPTRTAAANRLRAEDLASRGIPTYRDDSGRVTAVRDDSGAALTHFDRAHGIAYDSEGNPKSINYGETGAPTLKDPFEDLPTRTDESGNIYKAGRGGLYQNLGVDPAVQAAAQQKEKDAEVAKQSTLLNRKLTLDEYDLTHGAKDRDALKKDLTSSVSTLLDPKYEGADRATVLKGIDEHFNSQYAAPEANATRGWFSKDLSPEAQAMRADIDQRKAKAMDQANSLFDMNDKLADLHDSVGQTRQAERDRVETLLAHSQGQAGPLDQPAQETPGSAKNAQLYPPVEDWPRMLGDNPKEAPDHIIKASNDGAVPAFAAPAAVAAAHDAADAQQKADDLREKNPTLADQFEAAGKNILSGVGNAVAELTKSPLGQGVIAAAGITTPGLLYNPLTGVYHSPEERSKQFADAITAANPKLEDRLNDTVGGKIGGFVGGVLPYVAATVASGPAAPAVDGALFFSSGYQNTYDDAKAHGASEDKAHAAGLINGSINALLAMPLKTVGKAYEAVFGDTAPKVITRAIQNAYDHGGPEATGTLLGHLAEAIKAGGEGSEKLRSEAVEGINNVLAEIQKTPAQRIADVAKTAAGHAAIGGGVQTAQNLVSQSYDHERGTFENVPEQALGFGALGAISKGFEQVAAARKAKQALDIIAKGGEPPTGTGLPGPKAPEPGPAGPTEKPANAKEVTPAETKTPPAATKTPPAATKTPEAATEPAIGAAEKAYVEQGGHIDKLDAQEKLAKLREAFPSEPARMAAIEKHLEPVDTAAHEAATSPKNGLAEPTDAQKEAGNYQKGHVTLAGMDVSIENPAGSQRKPEFPPLQSHYGYIRGTVGADKDHVDLFIKPGTPKDWSGPVFVVNQVDKSGKFDEHKAVIGVNKQSEALAEYNSNYEKGWKGAHSVVKFSSPAEFKAWAQSGAASQPASQTMARIKPPEGGTAFAPQTSGAHIISTAVKQGDRYLVGQRWNEAHEGIGVRHGMDTVPDSQRGFIVQDAKGKQSFVSRTEAGPIAEASGQVIPPINEKGLQSHQLSKAPELPKFVSDYWSKAKSGPEATAFTPERLKLAGISKREVATAIAEAVKRGAPEEFILDRSKYTATKNAYEDIKNWQPEKAPTKPATPQIPPIGGKYVLPSFVTEPHVRADTRARAERLKDLSERFNALKEVPATDVAVIKTLLDNTSAKSLDAAEKKIAKYEQKSQVTPRDEKGGGSERPAETKPAEPSGAGLAPAGAASADAIADSRKRLERVRRDVLPKLEQRGLEIAETKLGRSGIATARDGSSILVDHDTLAKAASAFTSPDRAEQWMRDALNEEVHHYDDVLVSGAQFEAIHKGIWRGMSPEAKRAIRATYIDSTEPVVLAAEYLRMVRQVRETGRITESHFRDVAPVMAAITAKQSAALENHIRSMDGLTKGATDATQTGQEPRSDKPEHQGVSPGSDLRPDKGEVRQENGGQAGGGGVTGERAPAPAEQKPRAGQPQKESALDAETQQQLRDTMEGLFAGRPQNFDPARYQAQQRRTHLDDFATRHGYSDSEAMRASAPELYARAEKEIPAPVSTGDVELLKGENMRRLADPAWMAKQNPKSPAAAEKLIRGYLNNYGKLYAATPNIEQKAIPPDKVAQFVQLATKLVAQGVDTPEKLAHELETAFQGKARPFSQALWDAIGMVRPDLRGTHNWGSIYLAAPTEREEAPAAQKKDEQRKVLQDQFARRMLRKDATSRTELTALAKDIAPDLSPKEIDETAEAGLVTAARTIVGSMRKAGKSNEDIFDRLVQLYNDQPNLTAKTSTSKVNQAYSTPMPLAWTASVLADISLGSSVYEPTAGNGALIIGADPKNTLANELNDQRRDALREQGFKPTNGDATLIDKAAMSLLSVLKQNTGDRFNEFDRVIANPPFGTILDEDQEKKTWPLVGTKDTTDQIDQAIALTALQHMQDDGRAVLILGGKNIKDPEERAKAYATPNQMKFWKPLYEQYRVVDHFTVDGDLYKKQGAGWPVDVVVIAGKGKSPIQLPSADGPRIIGSWDGLRTELGRSDEDRIAAGRYDPQRDAEKVSGVIGDLRQLAGSESATGPSGDAERADERPGREPSVRSPERPAEDVQPAAGREPARASTEGTVGGVGAAGNRVEPVERGQLGDYRVPYKPASKLNPIGIFVPTNMEVPAREALRRLQETVGNIDDFVRGKLGYRADAPIERYFAAEQMDALALAIAAIEGKTAFVLGDQGGIGKGRVAAGMMAYALNSGQMPIFVTKDVKLYAEMIKDLADIGRPDIQPLFTDNDIAFEDPKGGKWQQGYMRPTMEEIARTGKLPSGSDVLFTTYAQIQSDVPANFRASKAERAAMKAKHAPPPDGARMEALKKLAPNAIIIADESHLASGDSIRAWRLSPLLHMAHGVYYSSATFAKRPDSLGIYSRTSLQYASTSMDELASAMRQGGVPLQQVVSATLASDGLYLRRERDFRNAVFRTHINVETRDRDTELADNYTDGLRAILNISNRMKAATKMLNKLLRREGKTMHVENPPRVESTNFASKLHNLVSQYLFAIKAESAVRRAVEGVTKGFANKQGKVKPHKVIIAVQNTMEQPILAMERSSRPLNFKGMLLAYLDTQRTLTSGRGPQAQQIVITNDPNPDFERYTDKDLQRLLIVPNPEDPEKASVNEPALAELFRRIMAGVFRDVEAKIDGLDLADMPLSPIDHIRRELTKAGIKNEEITKRGTGIDEDGKVYQVPSTSNSKAAHLRYLSDFNNGDTDALVINASGSTGISAHASSTFKRQDPRAMIIAQPHLDINEFVQTLYRIDRTGQVHQPYYELLQTAIPAELRPAAILGRKMGSLNANTTSNAENEVSEGNKGTDIFNQYGDEVVYEYLRTDPTFVAMLDMPKIMHDDVLAPIDDVLGEYEEKGQFAAAVTGRVAVLPTAEQENFWQKVTADYIAKIDYLNQLGENELTSDTIDLKAETLARKELTPAKEGTSGFSAPSYIEKIRADIGMKPLAATEVVQMMNEFAQRAPAIREAWQNRADQWRANELDRLSRKVLSWDVDKAAHYEARWREQAEEINAAFSLIGAGLHLTTEKGLDGYGAITDLQLDDEHPLTPSKQIFTVQVNTTKKTLRVPASQLPSIARMAVGDFPKIYEATAERSNERHMITGNLLAAYLAIHDSAPTAKIVQYTTDQGENRQGILMPAKFTEASLAKKRIVESPTHMQQLLEAGRSLTNSGGEVTIVKSPSGGYVMRVPSSRVMGGQYWRDAKLAGLMDGGEFIERGGAMIGKFANSRIPEVYQRLLDLNASLFFTEQDQSLGAANPLKAIQALYKDDVEPIAKSIGVGVKEALRAVQHVVSPTAGVSMDAHDQVMRMLGERVQKAYETDRVLEGYRQMFDKMPRPQQIAFIDRMKLGEKQPTPELQQVADTMRRIDTETWEAARAAYSALGFKDKEIPLSWLENHFRVLWKKLPGGPDKGEWIGRARRGLRGSMGQHKQHTLDTMSDGLTEGGVPYSYNPVVMFKLAQVDLWKLTTTLKTWKWGKDNGFVEFVRGPFPKAPDGMVKLDDAIARVYFPAESGEGLVTAGEYFVEEGFGRLLNNYLSQNLIRQSKMGRGLFWLKNATTQLELALSAFHAVFETGEAVGSSIGHGLTKLVNRGLLHGDLGAAASGLYDMTIGAAIAPVTGFQVGREFRKAIADPAAYFKTPAGRKMEKNYPGAARAAAAIFDAGFKPPELEQDWKNNSIRTFTDAVADIKAGSSDNYVGAVLRAFPAANEFLMKPLFDHYIPSLKAAQFLKEFPEAIRQNERKLKGGVLTEAALARQVWREVENRFGELNYDTLFWNGTFKGAMQLMFRSVTWKLGSVSQFGGAVSGQGKEFIDAVRERRAPQLDRRMAWMLGMFLLTATLGTIMMKVLSGKDPKGLTDLVFPQIDPKDEKVRASLPTYFKDLVHLIHAPTSYVTSSMSGWIGRLMDLLRNKDYYGVQIRNTDDPATKQALQVGKYAAETLLPFSIRGYKNLSASDVGTLRKAMALVGVNPAPRYIAQSSAEKAVEAYWRGQQTEAGVSPEQFEASAAKRAMVAELRHGQQPNISEALAKGTLKPHDIPALYDRARMGALVSGVNHMPLRAAEKVYAQATPAEKSELAAVMARKRENSRKSTGAVFARGGRSMFGGF